MGSVIIGSGRALPARIVTNDELSEIVDTTDEWIVPRTGIHTRHVAIEETCTDLGTQAALRALGYAQKISVLGVYLVYGAVLAVTLWQRSGQFWRVLAVPAAVYVLGTLLRAAINRPRPYEALNFTPLFPKDTKGQSMPSRHCFSAAAIVTAAFTVWVPLGVAACLLAAVVAVTRVLTGVHYPSDVLAGLAFGAGAAVIGFLL